MSIVVGLTTIPSRINKCKSTIDSLINQKTLFPYTIEINIPHFYRRFDKTIDKIPQFMRNDKIKICRTEDYGCITKLIPCLYSHTKYNDIIVSCDDDIVYPPKWLSTLVNNQAFANETVCFRGRNFTNECIKYENTYVVQCDKIQLVTRTNILTATWGVAYSRSVFNDDFFDIPLDSEVFFSDDSYISGYLSAKKKPIYVIPFDQTISGTKIGIFDSLWSINRRSQNNNKTLKIFEKYFIEDIKNG